MANPLFLRLLAVVIMLAALPLQNAFGARPSSALCSYEPIAGVRHDLRNPYTIVEYESSVTGDGSVFRGEPRELEHYRSQVRPLIRNGASLIDADFCGFDLGGALAPNGGTVGLAGARLWRARFYYANLTSANFHNAELNGAIFGWCDGSNCQGAAEVSGADFSGADLRAADMSAMVPFDTIFNGALFNQYTLLPLQWGSTDAERRRRAVADFGMVDEERPVTGAGQLQKSASDTGTAPIPASRISADGDSVPDRGSRGVTDEAPVAGTPSSAAE